MQVALTKIQQAIETYDELLRILRLDLPESDLRVLAARGKRAEALSALGKSEEALRELKEVLGLLGPVDSAGQYISSILTSTGNLELTLGHSEDALADFRRQLEIDEARVGPKHPEIIWSLNGIGMALQALNRWSESLAPLRRAHALGVATKYQPDLVAYTQLYLARALLRAGQRTEALALAREAESTFAQFPAEAEQLKEARAILRSGR
jgi:tetratricopeptide (TPR) repeat protein